MAFSACYLCAIPRRDQRKAVEMQSRGKFRMFRKAGAKRYCSFCVFYCWTSLGTFVQHNLDKLLNKAHGFGSLTVLRERA